MSKELSNEEIALYDRQIRLWGLEAQGKIKTSKVLLINLSSLGTEITKNLVLGGIGSLTILDNHSIKDQDLYSGSQYYIQKKDLGIKRLVSAEKNIKELNPRVELNLISDEKIINKDKGWFKQFTLVVGTELNNDEIDHLNKITREWKIPFYSTGLNGLFGYCFVDLIDHYSVFKKEKSNIASVEGRVNSLSEIVKVETNKDENDQVFENITIKNQFNSWGNFLKNIKEGSENIGELYSTKKKLKKITPILPLYLSILSNSKFSSVEELTKTSVIICESLKIPKIILENNERIISQFFQSQNTEFAPISAILGGIVSQDVINTLGNKNKPLNNFILVDGIRNEVPIFHI